MRSVQPTTLLHLVLIVGLTCLAYANSFEGEYQIDDGHVIRENPQIRSLWETFRHVGTSTRSLVNFTFAVNYAAGGTDRWGYHLVNLIIQVLAALAIYAWLRTILPARNRHVAFFVALLFGVHPLTTQSVTYLTQRYSSLCGLFFFASLWSWARFRASDRWAWYGASLAFALAAMLCKEMAVAIPIALVAADFSLHAARVREGILAPAREGPTSRRWLASALPFRVAAKLVPVPQPFNSRSPILYLPLAALFSVVPILNAVSHDQSLMNLEESLDWSQGMDIGRWVYLLTQIRQIVFIYLRLMLVPLGQSVDHPVVMVESPTHPQTALAACLLLALLSLSLFACYVQRNRLVRLAGFGGLLFFLGLAATSTVIPNHAIVQEQRLYVSLAGFLLAGCTLFWLIPLHRFLTAAFLSAAAIMLAVLTYDRNKIWRSESVVWRDAVQNAADSPRSHNNLALALVEVGKIDEAVKHYKEAIRINPNYAIAYNNLGNILFRGGHLGEATQYYAEAVRLAPEYAEAHNNLGAALEAQGEVDQAITHCLRALDIEPNMADAHNNLGNAFSARNDLATAMHHYREAIRIYTLLDETKHRAMAHNNLANALARLERYQEAVPHYEEALRLDPSYEVARRTLAHVVGVLQRPDVPPPPPTPP